MTRAENVARILALRDQGFTHRQIAAEIGLARRTVSNYIYDPDGTKIRARKDSYRGACVVCGVATNGSRGPGLGPDYCRSHKPLDAEWLAKKTKWTRARIIAAIKFWEREYGDPPAGHDWNPHDARHVLHDEERALRAERWLKAGAIPWFTSVVRVFGSWSSAIEAAGFTPRARHGGGGNQYRRRDHRTPRTHCKHGHEYTYENIYEWRGRRLCRECGRRRSNEYHARQRNKAAA